MIWVDGKILPDDGLVINAADRTFEHGLGLFETLRTWGGRPALLDRHRARMLGSAEALGLPIDPRSLPDEGAVRDLLDAEGVERDRMLRITATGGTASGRSVVWMRSGPIPAAIREGGAIVCVNAWAIDQMSHDREPRSSPSAIPIDFNTRHKTLNYWSKRVAYDAARALGYDETLIHCPPWGHVEASRSNLFLITGDTLTTCSTETPIVPGIMRQLALDVSRELPLDVREIRRLEPSFLQAATEIFLTNAVRGIIPVARVDTPEGPIERPAPGPWTRRLQDLIARQLRPDRGDAP